MRRILIFCTIIMTALLLGGCGRNKTQAPENIYLTKEEAQNIALTQVPGATSQDIRQFKSDHDNGKLKYEGKIHFENTAYEFEIDANTGEITEWDVEPIR